MNRAPRRFDASTSSGRSSGTWPSAGSPRATCSSAIARARGARPRWRRSSRRARRRQCRRPPRRRPPPASAGAAGRASATRPPGADRRVRRRPEGRAVRLQLGRLHRRGRSIPSFEDEVRDQGHLRLLRQRPTTMLRQDRRRTAAATTSRSRPRSTSRRSSSEASIQPLDQSPHPEHRRTSAPSGRTRATTRATRTPSRTCGGPPASATTRPRSPRSSTSWDALWDATYTQHISMLDDCREVFAAGAVPARVRPEHDRRRAARRRRSRCSRSRSRWSGSTRPTTSACLRRRRVDHARLGRGRVPVSEDDPNGHVLHPEEGGVRGSDTMVLLSGAQHPIAAHLFINSHARRAGQRREHELHRLHGPQRGGQGVHRPGDPRGPDGEPRPGGRRRSSSSSTSAPTLRKYPSAGTRSGGLRRPSRGRAGATADAVAGSRPSPSSRPARRAARAPGVAWLALFFVVPLAIIFVVSLGTRDQFGGVILDQLEPRQLRQRALDPASCRRS